MEETQQGKASNKAVEDWLAGATKENEQSIKV